MPRPLRGQSLQAMNLDEEFSQIKKLVDAGIEPSSQRLKEYIQASCLKGNTNNDIPKVVACIGDILRQEEERVCETDPILRDMLVVLESGQSSAQLNKVFMAKIH